MFWVLARRKHSSGPRARDVICMTFSMVWMLALPSFSQHSKNYKIASKMALELGMHLDIIFCGLDVCSAIASSVLKVMMFDGAPDVLGRL